MKGYSGSNIIKKLINFILIFVDNSTTSSSLQWAGVVTVKDNADNVREEQDLILEEVEDDNSVLIEVYLQVYMITCTQCMRLSQYSVVNNKYNLLHVFLVHKHASQSCCFGSSGTYTCNYM